MEKILFVKPADYSFVINDQHLLEKHFRVKSFLIARKDAGFHFVWRILNLIFFVIMNSGGTRGIVTWFADYHAAVLVVLGKILRIKVVIIAGGQEAISYPELKKGVYSKKFRGSVVRFALRHAAHILPNHESLIYHENYYYDPKGKKDGFKFYIPDLKTKITVIHNGMDLTRFYRDETIVKDPETILTVGTMNSVYDFINKGFDLFISLAARNPHLHFVMIGIRKQFLPWIEAHYPYADIPNLEVIFSFCPHEVLFENYNKAKVFVQASITEGMPNTLCESMLCECIPVGSAVNGIPDTIGDTGIIVKERNVEQLEKAVKQALLLNSGKEARERIIRNFSFQQREEKMTAVLNEEFLKR